MISITDIITFLKNHYKREPSEELSRLIEEHERITGKPYYIKVPKTRGDQISASISTDYEKHTIDFPESTLRQINNIAVAEVMIAHEILHTKLD